jgi:hypothetical protein
MDDDPITGTAVDDTTDSTFTVHLVPDNPAVVMLQEHQAGRLRSVLWIAPEAARELGRLLVAIASPLVDEYDPTRGII